MKILGLTSLMCVAFLLSGCASDISTGTFMSWYTNQDGIEFTVRKDDRDYGRAYGDARYGLSRMILGVRYGESNSQALSEHPVMFRSYSKLYVRKSHLEFLRMAYMDVTVQFRYAKNFDIPIYRVIFTPVRNINQEEINKIPSKGIFVYRSQYKLPFILPEDRTLVGGQIYTDWSYCAECMVNQSRAPKDDKERGEYFRKLNKVYRVQTDFKKANEFSRWKSPADISSVVFFTSQDEKKYSEFGWQAWRFKVAKFNAKDALIARNELMNLQDENNIRLAGSVSANKSYHDFINNIYKPLTASHFLRKMGCGDYAYRNVNNSYKTSVKGIPINRHYLQCLSNKVGEYDIKGYQSIYPKLKDTESKLWDKAYGITRVPIETPNEQMNHFKKRFDDIKKELDDMIYHVNRAEENAAREKRSRLMWANAFNMAMSQIRQDNQRFTDNVLIANSNGTVTTVKQARENAIQAAKMQEYLDSAQSHSTSSSHEEQSQYQAQKSGSSSSQKVQSTDNGQTKTKVQGQEKKLASAKDDASQKAQAEREKLHKGKAEQDRLIKEKAEKERLRKEQLRKEKLEKEKREREKIVYTIALTWHNKAGKWFACGPLQCIQAPEDTEKAALDFVVGNKHVVGSNYYYRCNQYTLSSRVIDTAGDLSEAAIKRNSVCMVK